MAIPSRYYVIDQVTGEPRRCPTADAWARWALRFDDPLGNHKRARVLTYPPETTGIPVPNRYSEGAPCYDLWPYKDGRPC